ncbi:cob(I)yrinic acid a,c-diamide adenosyltransferase [Myroides sp. WP-1]|uniref:cob(I)yrinic acid a,c-diamide adenosyltransferase n=1 Tax=Myroides sp. WP-1 TaxID=2759944 RepID=UPI0015FD2BED|nr:cob(I)yrinic acid a,c-diamide adenosyltransferase [Myroides sp. WP-1]MBB1139170.1 cob(I)yrinic acid a,c-diamide adenosyltransferase [Myroides sp. WP-1]
MKIYTKTGDEGTTALFGGTRVPKNHIRIEAYGTIDELNAYVGMIRDQEIPQIEKEFLLSIQNQLFTLGAMLATDPQKALLKNGKERLNIPKITADTLVCMESEIDRMESHLPPMTHFILPGGHPTVSFCHIARCVCRRAERLSVQLDQIEPVEEEILKYINRLSDYLFVLARKLTLDLQAEEIKWIPEKLKEDH